MWGVSYESMVARFESPQMMAAPGIPTTRYFDAATLPKDQIQQRDRLKAMMVFGHGGNTVTRMPEAVKGLEAMELLVVADPHPTTFAVLANRRENTYLLPICTQFECDGSRTASNRSVQWGAKIVNPIFESKDDYEVMYRLTGALDRAAERRNMPSRFQADMFKDNEIRNNAPTAESLLREINRGALSTGYTAQSPERLKLHMEHQDKFDLVTLRGREGTPVANDFYGMPWPAWGKPEWKHPGSHILYNTSLDVRNGGGTFRPRFGVERNGVTLLAEGSWSVGSEIQDGYPEFTTAVLRRLGWYDELTAEEKGWIESNGGNFSWATDLSFGELPERSLNDQLRTVVWADAAAAKAAAPTNATKCANFISCSSDRDRGTPPSRQTCRTALDGPMRVRRPRQDTGSHTRCKAENHEKQPVSATKVQQSPLERPISITADCDRFYRST
ncbi:molybdopterin-dependent oxidoreductase [Leptolyngbya sp. 15MV]|nr:molybdopterin-dependent oxidoreductase [Leptolyngbya sp. 15MV]